jgi:two-component system, cell cycle sensor histidine kinase and response regulator CckA
VLTQIWKGLVPRNCWDSEKLRIAGAVRALAISFGGAIVPALVIMWINHSVRGGATLLATGAALLFALYLNRRGQTEWAVRTLTGAVLAGSTAMVYFSGSGYRDLTLLGFPAILATAALLLTPRFYRIYAATAVTFAAGLILLQILNLHPYAKQSGTYKHLIMVIVILGLIAFSVSMMSNALRRSLSDYRTLIEQAGEGVIVLDKNRRIAMCNSSAAEVFGVPETELLGRSFRDFLPPEDLSFMDWGDRPRSTHRTTFETTTRRPDGSARHLLMTCTPRLSEEGRWVGIIAVLVDVTKTRESDNQIRLLAQALQSTDSCVRISDTSDRVIYANPAFLQTYGFTESELLGQSIEIARSSRNPPGLDKEILTSALRDGWSGELWSRTRDGREFPTALTCSVVRNDRGEAIATVGVSRDLTQKKAVEGALEESRRRFQAFLEHGDLLTLLLDRRGLIISCNDAVLAILGKRREEVVGTAAVDYLAPDSRERHLRDLAAAFRQERLDRIKEMAVIDTEGRKRWFQWSTMPIRGGEGKVAELACIAFEITEQRLLQEEYLQAQKLDSIGRLAGGIAHDFNNLLTVINGYSAMLLDMLAEDERGRPLAQEIHAAGLHAAGLTGQLLTFSRKQVVAPRPTDLGAVVRDSERMLERVIGEDVRLVTKLDPTAPRVMADPDHMRQVIMNLAVNARDAMPDGGVLEISTQAIGIAPGSLSGEAPGEYVQLTVTDSGIGMDDHTLQHLFEPFFTTKQHGKGTGLGMATVYGIVKQSRGSIDVTSAPGAGTTVTIHLPRTNAAAQPKESQAATNGVEDGGTVLIVEDQDIVRELAATVLGRRGYSTMEAATGPEALQLLQGRKRGDIDLLLTDVILPGMSGRELADRVRSEFPEIKVLFTSGYTGDVLGRRGVLEDGLEFLPKPFTPAALVDKVRAILATGA